MHSEIFRSADYEAELGFIRWFTNLWLFINKFLCKISSFSRIFLTKISWLTLLPFPTLSISALSPSLHSFPDLTHTQKVLNFYIEKNKGKILNQKKFWIIFWHCRPKNYNFYTRERQKFAYTQGYLFKFYGKNGMR